MHVKQNGEDCYTGKGGQAEDLHQGNNNASGEGGKAEYPGLGDLLDVIVD